MKEISMIIRPEKLEEVKSILDEINCGGMTITTAMGCGAQKGVTGVNEIKGFKTTINLLPKISFCSSQTHICPLVPFVTLMVADQK